MASDLLCMFVIFLMVYSICGASYGDAPFVPSYVDIYGEDNNVVR